MTPAEHVAEAERLVELAHALNGNYRDREGRVTLLSDAARPLAALATAHAAIASAQEAIQTRKNRGGR